MYIFKVLLHILNILFHKDELSILKVTNFNRAHCLPFNATCKIRLDKEFQGFSKNIEAPVIISYKYIIHIVRSTSGHC